MRELLVAIEAPGEPAAWRLEYDAQCRLASLSMPADPPAGLAPAAYNNPLGFSSPGRRLDFGYAGPQLATIRLTDTVQRVERIREYEVRASGGRVSDLLPLTVLLDGQPVSSEGVALRYVYDPDGRVDSVVYSDGNSIGYAFDEAGDLTRADYRAFAEGRATTEYYGYADPPANPLAGLPLHYVMTYALYRAPRLPSNATFDLRSYRYDSEGGRLVRQTDLTFGDSAAVSSYVYEVRVCE